MLFPQNKCGLQPQTYDALQACAGRTSHADLADCTNQGDCATCPVKEYRSRAVLPIHGAAVYVREGWDKSPHSMNHLSQGWRSTGYWGYDWKDLAMHTEWYPAEFGADEDSRWVLMRKGERPCN